MSPKQGKPFVPPLNMSRVEDLIRLAQSQQKQADLNNEKFNDLGFQGEVVLNDNSGELQENPQSEIREQTDTEGFEQEELQMLKNLDLAQSYEHLDSSFTERVGETPTSELDKAFDLSNNTAD